MFISGDELFSDAFKYKYEDDDFVITVQGKVNIIIAFEKILLHWTRWITIPIYGKTRLAVN